MSRLPAKRLRTGILQNQYRSFGSLRYRLVGLIRSYGHLRRECKLSEARDCATRIADVAEQLAEKVERTFPDLAVKARQVCVMCVFKVRNVPPVVSSQETFFGFFFPNPF